MTYKDSKDRAMSTSWWEGVKIVSTTEKNKTAKWPSGIPYLVKFVFSETNVLSIRVRFGSCKNPRIGHEVFMSLGDKCLSMRCLCTPWILVFVCNS